MDGLLDKFRDPEKNDNGVELNLSTLRLLVIHIGSDTFPFCVIEMLICRKVLR